MSGAEEERLIGLVFALMSAGSFALVPVFIRLGGQRHAQGTGVMTTIVSNVVVLSVVAAATVVLAPAPSWSWSGAGLFVLAGALTTFVARSALFTSIRHIGAARSAAIKSSTPLVAIAFAVGVLGESLSAPTVLATALMGAALVVLARETLISGEADTSVAADANHAPHLEEAKLGASPHLGLTLALLSAVSFGLGLGVRRVGIEVMPSPTVGAAIGAWTALCAYGSWTLLQRRFRPSYSLEFGSRNAWFWAAGGASSLGALTFFAAIALAPLSHVAIVASLETLLTIAVAVAVLRRIELVTKQVVAAGAAMAISGGILAWS